MAWERIHRTINANGGVSVTTGYLSETITLGDDADSSTSHLPIATKSDATILAVFDAASTFVCKRRCCNDCNFILFSKFRFNIFF